jgi:hypothetical protein
MEGYCSTGQSPQRAVVPMEEEEEEEEEEEKEDEEEINHKRNIHIFQRRAKYADHIVYNMTLASLPPAFYYISYSKIFNFYLINSDINITAIRK